MCAFTKRTGVIETFGLYVVEGVVRLATAPEIKPREIKQGFENLGAASAMQFLQTSLRALVVKVSTSACARECVRLASGK
jgi:hypothetical protein